MSLSKAKISELDYLFKNNAANKVKTDTTQTPILADNEGNYTAKVVTGDNVLLASSKLKEGATAALAASIVVKRDFVKMMSVHISNIPALVGIAWNSGFKNWVDPFIDLDFAPKFQVALSTAVTPLTSTNSSIIDSDDSFPFVFDYKTGILTFLDVPYNANGFNLTEVIGSNTRYNVFISGYTYSGPSLEKLAGGSIGQTLIKNSAADYDVKWSSSGVMPLGGVKGQVIAKNSTAAYDASWSDPGLSWKEDFKADTTSLEITGEVYSYKNIAYTSVTDTLLPIDTPPNKIVFQYPGLSNEYYTVDPAYKSTYQSLQIYAPDSTNSRINAFTKAPLTTTGSTRPYTSSVLSTQSAGTYSTPISICVDEFSKIYAYILDSGPKLIKRLVVSGPTIGQVETVTLSGGTLDNPKRIIINSTGLILYVSDVNGVNGSIKKIVLSVSSIGKPIGTVSTITTWPGSPVGLVLDNTEKYIYTCDIVKHVVYQILVASPNTIAIVGGISGESGNIEGFSAIPPPPRQGEQPTIPNYSRFNGPTDIAIDYSGMLYVSDTGNNSIRTIEVKSSSGITKTFASNITSPAGISVDSFKNVYVASNNGLQNRILKISQSLSQTVLATVTSPLSGIYIRPLLDINFYYPLLGEGNGFFVGRRATYLVFQRFSNQPVLFPYVSQYMMEIVPIYNEVSNYNYYTNDLSITIFLSETPGIMQTAPAAYNNRIVIDATTVSVVINSAEYSKFKYVDNPDFTKTAMSGVEYLRIYRVGSILRLCVISGVKQLTMAEIDLSKINEALTRNFTFDVNYDVIPIVLNGKCQYSRFTIYKLPILERVTERIPDTTVYTSWSRTYSSNQDSSYTAGSIIQSNNSLYIRSNIPNTAILDRTLNSPIYESSFKGQPGFAIGTASSDGNGLSAAFTSINQLIYDATRGYLYALDNGSLKTIDIGTSPLNPQVITRISSFQISGLYDGKLYRFNQIPGPHATINIRMAYASASDYTVVNPNGNLFGSYDIPSAIVPADGQGNFFICGPCQIRGGYNPYDNFGEIPSSYIAKYSTINDTLVPIFITRNSYSDGNLPSPNIFTPAFRATPASLAYDSTTNTLFISDPGSHTIRILTSPTPSTSFTSLSTIAGSGVAGYRDDVGPQVQFNNPQGIALDGLGNLYICDYGNKLIRKLNIQSKLVTTVAGIYGSSGFIDGRFGTSTLTAPKSITFVSTSNLMYFTESESNLVRSFNILTTEVLIVAGNTDVLKDLFTLDRKTQKISNTSLTTYQSAGLFMSEVGGGSGNLPFLTFPGGSILEFSVFSGTVIYLQIDASPGGSTYVRITNAGAEYFDGTTNTIYTYSGSYSWKTGDILRVIKQPYYVYVQYIRNNIVTNILGFDTPIYSPLGFQQETKFSFVVTSIRSAYVTSRMVEYPLPVWDLLLTDSSANVTDNFSVAVGTGTNNILYSANGLAWFPVSGKQFTIFGSRVAWNGSLWFAVGSGTNRVIWSSNGTTWSTDGLVVPSTFTAGNDVASNGTLWLALGTGTTPVIQTTNSLNWTAVTVTGLTIGKAVAWNGSNWVLGGVGSSSIYSSYDGVNWTAAVSGAFSIECNGVATNGRLWVAVGKHSTSEQNVAYSSDGSTWNRAVLFTNRGNGVAWNGHFWIAVGEGGFPIFSSANGMGWTNSGITLFDLTSIGLSSIGNSIAWNGNVWIATGTWYNSTNTSIVSSIITSPDGSVWSPVYGSPFTENLARGCASRKPLPNSTNSVVSSKGMFVYNGSGTSQIIANSTVTSTSNIMITLATASPSVPSSLVFVSGITSGTSFSVKGVSGDGSTYNYIIL
jgi:hypothetical protein